MKRTVLAMLAVTAVLAHTPAMAATTPADLAGDWIGVLEKDGARLDLRLHLRRDGDALKGEADLPWTALLGAEILGARVLDDGRLRVSLPLPLGSLRLIGNLSEGAFSGSFEHVGRVAGEWKTVGEGRFRLARAASSPQLVEEVAFANGEVALAGSLTRPAGLGPYPLVVFVQGSGDATRKEAAFVADGLAKAGIATFAFDKRGTGASKGDWRTVGFDAQALDVAAATRAMTARADIDASRTGLWCHSEGCWVSPVALAGGADARFLVATSGPGVDPDEEDYDHFRQVFRDAGRSEAEFARARALLELDNRVSLGLAPYSELEARVAAARAESWFKVMDWTPAAADDPDRRRRALILPHDTAAGLDALRVPSLWLYGGEDRIIPVPDSAAAVRASRARPRPEVVVLEGADHLLTAPGPAGLPRLADGYPDLAIDWIRRTIAR